MNDREINRLAKIIWDYHHMHQKLEKADCILVLGSHDLRVAEYGGQLFLAGWAPRLIVSGGRGFMTKDWAQTEAEKFAEIITKMGVPAEKISIEDKATNTGENILFSKKILAVEGIACQTFIVVTKPYMERRAYATFKKVWPEKYVVVTSQPVSFEEYAAGPRSKDETIAIMVRDFLRIKLYAEKGFQIPQEIPSKVWDAYEKLALVGYNKYLIDD